MVPTISEFGLPANIPDSELETLIVDLFYIESNGWDWVDILVEFHLVEDCGFSSVVETEHKNLGLHVRKGCEEFCDVAAHMFGWS